MVGTAYLYNKLLEATIKNTLLQLNDETFVVFSGANNVVSTCDCYFSTNKLIDTLKKPFALKNGLCYSINYETNNVLFQLVLNKKYFNNDYLYNGLLEKYGAKENDGKTILFQFVICPTTDFEDGLKKAVLDFFNKAFNSIEEKLVNTLVLIDTQDSKNNLHEGSLITVELTKYERNQEARTLCIKHYGAKCAVCGFDFGKVYGDDFKGMIEVHHTKPLHTIKKDYVVDPINDLVPVCPNCHAAIHLKKDGFYNIEEMKEIFKRNNP